MLLYIFFIIIYFIINMNPFRNKDSTSKLRNEYHLQNNFVNQRKREKEREREHIVFII